MNFISENTSKCTEIVNCRDLEEAVFAISPIQACTDLAKPILYGIGTTIWTGSNLSSALRVWPKISSIGSDSIR